MSVWYNEECVWSFTPLSGIELLGVSWVIAVSCYANELTPGGSLESFRIVSGWSPERPTIWLEGWFWASLTFKRERELEIELNHMTMIQSIMNTPIKSLDTEVWYSFSVNEHDLLDGDEPWLQGKSKWKLHIPSYTLSHLSLYLAVSKLYPL